MITVVEGSKRSSIANNGSDTGKQIQKNDSQELLLIKSNTLIKLNVVDQVDRE